ncbi:LysR family transcriptional regulator [Rhodoferax sp. BAB1]|uniref:LysR family transcriptional regulator n=1 Tax=Rhodoferax sp. BAB1 TaxID=2741720 RepID=UPI0015763BEE|nr:LysR family transcriptional regulator [Rhodoferax sp. BAB1]QKO20962.1 LysR family transcriptional regulator [Rhodoferax sp. BAB1]
MEFRQIQYFLSLYDEGSMTKAASRLNVVQPALSMQLAKLESELGQQLFIRSTRGMEPTPAGRQMYKLFRPVMGDFARARELLMQTDGELSGHVSIGLIATVAQDLLAGAVTEFSEAHPRVTLSLSDGYTPALCQAVTEGLLDAAIINQPRRKLALNSHPVLSEDFVLATGLRHAPLSETVALRQATALKLVLPTRLHGLRDILESFAQVEGVELSPALEVDSMNALLQLVEMGSYATLLPRIAVRSRVEEGTLLAHTIVEPPLVRHVVCVTHPRRALSPAASAFIAMLEQHAQSRTATSPTTPVRP